MKAGRERLEAGRETLAADRKRLAAERGRLAVGRDHVVVERERPAVDLWRSSVGREALFRGTGFQPVMAFGGRCPPHGLKTRATKIAAAARVGYDTQSSYGAVAEW